MRFPRFQSLTEDALNFDNWRPSFLVGYNEEVLSAQKENKKQENQACFQTARRNQALIGKGNDCLFPLYVKFNDDRFKDNPGKYYLRVPCGHCINCRIRRSREWSLRLEHESNYWKESVFVTLTYNDDSLPLHSIDPHLFFTDEEIESNPDISYICVPTHRPEHLRNYIKRVRKHVEHQIRFFAVGEYGTRFGRSHIHIMFFGIPYTRHFETLLKKLWPYGFVDVKPFTKGRGVYIAGYVQKKLYGKDKDFFRLPEFMRCSHHLGEQWLKDHIDQFDDDHPYIVSGDYKFALPRSYRKILVEEGRLKENRLGDLYRMQMSELRELEKHLVNTNTSMSDYFRGRISEAIEKQRKKTRRRDLTGDI